VGSLPRLQESSIVRYEFGSYKVVNTAQELQLKGASQRAQEPLDMAAEEATALEAIGRRQPVMIHQSYKISYVQ
jgi:hypothetical protein